jgi:Cytochrome c554 and c-prime
LRFCERKIAFTALVGYKARMRVARLLLPALAFMAVSVPARAQISSRAAAPLADLLQESALPAPPVDAKYLGPGSCAASACHGGIQPRDTTKVLQNEYSTWIVQDRHSRAYNVLLQPTAQRMGQILNIGAPEKSQKCLVCHALSVPAAQIGRQFDISEGVSCENCHGPSSKWLGPHVQANARHADMVRLGLVDNKDLIVRATKCLTCHLGAPGMQVDHEMLAAGHPDLTFELDSFSSIEPPHWTERAADERQPIADPLFGVRIWSVGQVVQLRESMLRVARDARGPVWPEYTEMDCFTCHHSLTKAEDSWRQAAGYPGRRPGNPPYNMARYTVFQHFARSIDPSGATELEKDVSQVYALASDLQPDRTHLAAAADAAASAAATLEGRVKNAPYDRARTDSLMRDIASDGDAIAFQGERSAEQATMALDSLYLAETGQSVQNPAIRAAIDGMYKLLDNPSAYNAPAFAAQMKKVRAALGQS